MGKKQTGKAIALPQHAQLDEMTARMSAIEIARHFNVSYQTVYKWLRAYGISTRDEKIREGKI